MKYESLFCVMHGSLPYGSGGGGEEGGWGGWGRTGYK